MKIVVTGGAGSGKSTTIKRLQEALGSTFAYANVDDMVRNVWALPQVHLSDDEFETFKDLTGGRTKEQVRELSFTDQQFKFRLEAVFQNAVNEQINEAMQEENLILEFPLLYERFNRDLYERFNAAVVLSTSNTDERKLRLKARGWNPTTIDGVLKSQMTDRARKDFIIALKCDVKVFYIDTAPDFLYSIPKDRPAAEVRFIANWLKGESFKQRPPTAKVGIVAGSFDPVTLGHEHVIARAAEMMDNVLLVVANNPGKKTSTFDIEARMDMAQACLESLPPELRFKVAVIRMSESMLMVEWAQKIGARWLFRGLRDNVDLEYERKLDYMQTRFCPEVGTFYVMTPANLVEVSSSLVRGCIGLKGWERMLKAYTSGDVWRYILGLYSRDPDDFQ